MPAASFRVTLSREAQADLYEIVEYWSERGEAWRGEKYFRELTESAKTELADLGHARRGRLLKSRRVTGAREVLLFGVYRLIYKIDELDENVEVLRFWHAHRGDPLS